MPETSTSYNLKDYIRDVPDFPKPGITFKDITPLLLAPDALRQATKQLADQFRDQKIDVIIAAEARGFIFGTPLALELNVGFVPIRKPGKLPYEKHSYSYDLEYGSDTLEMHVDGLKPGQRVLVLDDLLATGGTVGACCKMVEQCQATVVACAFLIELKFLGAAEKLAPHPVFSLIEYE